MNSFPLLCRQNANPRSALPVCFADACFSPAASRTAVFFQHIVNAARSVISPFAKHAGTFFSLTLIISQTCGWNHRKIAERASLKNAAKRQIPLLPCGVSSFYYDSYCSSCTGCTSLSDYIRLVRLAPVNHLCSRLSAADTGIGYLLLLKRHTSGGYACNLL